MKDPAIAYAESTIEGLEAQVVAGGENENSS